MSPISSFDKKLKDPAQTPLNFIDQKGDQNKTFFKQSPKLEVIMSKAKSPKKPLILEFTNEVS